mmetsp:Transcript_5176/g.11733  ORF Transcript_5176/g.11733 Transcript_5176/m.11733 type:complete len:396 (+) Transcript_5176:64-1251(+)
MCSRAMDMKLKRIPSIAIMLYYMPFAKSSVCAEEPELHHASLLQHAISMSPSISADLGISAATVAPATNSAWQHTAVTLSSVEAVRNPPPLPPLLYLKTHKTGSSTIVSLIHRMGYRRNMSFMLPQPKPNQWNLGYKGPFPGEAAAWYYGPPAHQFDIICNHAVLNYSLMSAYLKPHPYFFTSVREPSDHMISEKATYFDTVTKAVPWDEYLDTIEHGDADVSHINNQAFDLGWYDFIGGTTDFDHDQSKISEWLTTLDKHLNSTVLLEYFDEGLALFHHKTKIPIEELTYLMKKDDHNKTYPTKDQRQRLDSLGTVDRALYAHLNQSFWREWFIGNVPQLEADVVTIRRLHQDRQQFCDEGDGKRCPETIEKNGKQVGKYAQSLYLKSKQGVLS